MTGIGTPNIMRLHRRRRISIRSAAAAGAYLTHKFNNHQSHLSTHHNTADETLREEVPPPHRWGETHLAGASTEWWPGVTPGGHWDGWKPQKMPVHSLNIEMFYSSEITKWHKKWKNIWFEMAAYVRKKQKRKLLHSTMCLDAFVSLATVSSPG